MKSTLLNFAFAAFLTLNIFAFHSPVIGVIFGLGFIGLSSWLLGKMFFSSWLRPNCLSSGRHAPLARQEDWGWLITIFFGFLTFLSITIVALAIIYYFYQLNDFIVAAYVILLSLTILLFRLKFAGIMPEGEMGGSFKFRKIGAKEFFHLVRPNRQGFASAGMAKWWTWFFVLIYLILLGISYLLLKNGQTFEPVRTPWHFVSIWFFIVYFLATLCLVCLVIRLKTAFSLILASLHLFFTFSVAHIIFPLGFGYDPFIHQATEKYILEHGFILPKPFYYLGQYSLVVFLTKIFSVSHIIIDKFLVSCLASILLPFTIYYTFRKLFVTFLFLFIPFSIFTFTTPQNLADLLVIITAFLGLSYLLNNKPTIYFLMLLTITALLIHPLAGSASVIFIIISLLDKFKIKKIVRFSVYLFLYFFISFIFIAFSLISPLYKINLVSNFNLTNFVHNLFRFSPDLFLNTNFVHLIKTIAYFIYDPLKIFLIVFTLSIVGFYVLKRNNYTLQTTRCKLLLTTFTVLAFNSLIIFSFLDFPFLINYERGDFSYRVFNLGVYFLIPLAVVTAEVLLGKMFRNKKSVMGCLFIAAVLTSSLYFSYPRHDVYYYTKGFNTSIYDFNAIKYLEEISSEDYVVLANQQVGAAALSTFGFRYFNHKYFFYSIPTGGDLYKIFAKMAYDGKVNYETAKIAMDLTGVNVVYFYLNDYWFNFKYLVPRAKKSADKTMVLENGKVWVFKYMRK